MDKKVTGILAYFGIILWLVAFLAGDKEGAKFHLNQALVLNLAMLAITLFCWIPFVNCILLILLLVLWVFAIMGIVGACKGEEKPLPLIGKIQILK